MSHMDQGSSQDNLDFSDWLPIIAQSVNYQNAQRRSDVFDGEVREVRSLKDRPREGREGSSEATTEGSTYFLPQGQKKRQEKRQLSQQQQQQHQKQQQQQTNKRASSKQDFDFSKEAGDGKPTNNKERDSKLIY